MISQSLTIDLVIIAFLFLSAFSLLLRIRQSIRANSWSCKPPVHVPSGPFGIRGYRALGKASSQRRLIDYIRDLHWRYGETFSMDILGSRAIFTDEPENIKALLATQFQDFGLGLRRVTLYPLFGDGIFTLDGPGWSHSRALLRPQFTRDQVL